MAEPMDEFPTVVVRGVEIAVDQRRPVAAVLTGDGSVRFATWPDLPVGRVEPEAVLLPAPDGAWVAYPPATVSMMDDSHDELLAGLSTPVVAVRPDGGHSVVLIGDRRVIGATSGRLWTAPRRQQRIDDDYRGEPMPPGWEEPTVLTAVGPDGSTTEVRVDRHILAVFEEDDRIHLVLAPTPPIAEPDDFGGCSYEYRISELTLPAAGPLPARLRFLDHHPDGIGPAVAPRRCWWTPHTWDMPPAPKRTIDLADVPGSRWALTAGTTVEQIAQATEAARGWFGDPDRFWFGEDGGVAPLATGLHDAEVRIEGVWPDTRVVVTFRHPHWPGGRLRRSLRVFDDAGRLAVNPYADIHLMEDLETGRLPPISEARDGYLDV